MLDCFNKLLLILMWQAPVVCTQALHINSHNSDHLLRTSTTSATSAATAIYRLL